MVKAVLVVCLGFYAWMFAYMIKHGMMNIFWCALLTVAFVGTLAAFPKEKE